MSRIFNMALITEGTLRKYWKLLVRAEYVANSKSGQDKNRASIKRILKAEDRYKKRNRRRGVRASRIFNE